MQYQILLYYKYVPIDDPTALMDSQRQLCSKLNLKGRIIIATEGINGTVEGTFEDTELYVQELTQDPRFTDIHWKKSEGTGNAFPRLSIKVRSEIVSSHLGERDVDPTKTTGKYLSPEELHQWFESGKQFSIVDMRNDYEHRVGHFENSMLPELANFRDLPEILNSIEHLRDKPVLTVCTGGVRCEKASGFLVTQGFTDVYQLQGGIVSYMEKFPNKNFLGKLYVFDGRIVMGFGDDAADDYVMLGRCDLCDTPSERYVNCANPTCHKHFICCTNCAPEISAAFCSEECSEKIRATALV